MIRTLFRLSGNFPVHPDTLHIIWIFCIVSGNFSANNELVAKTFRICNNFPVSMGFCDSDWDQHHNDTKYQCYTKHHKNSRWNMFAHDTTAYTIIKKKGYMPIAHLSMSSQRSCTRKTKYQRKKQRQVWQSPDRPDRKNVREKMLIEELGDILQERDFVKT